MALEVMRDERLRRNRGSKFTLCLNELLADEVKVRDQENGKRQVVTTVWDMAIKYFRCGQIQVISKSKITTEEENSVAGWHST